MTADAGAPERALAEALAALGLPCAVEAYGRLALLIPAEAPVRARLADPHLRRRVAALARAQGYTDIALDLDDMHDRAALRRA